MKKQEILKNQLIQKAQQYFTNIASIFAAIPASHFSRVNKIFHS
jgi:hypothetical protein